MMPEDQYEDEWERWAGMDFDPDRDCNRCQGIGKVPTQGCECYFGAQYKPCPECFGDDCFGEPPLS